MANSVFANGREIACKAGAGKTICAFPDVCMTPPESPATPPGIPIPYPNTGMASDTTGGSKNVKISTKEIMLKNKSCFKTSVGDEAGCAAKKGVVSSTNKGEVYFKAWSMDVKIEGENVDRHLDLTTNNHACDPGDTPPWPFVDRMEMAKGLKSCGKEISAADKACKKGKGGDFKCPKQGRKSNATYSKHMESNVCQRALRCMLSPKKPSKCCGDQTPHHLVPGASFKDMPSEGSYNYNAAPCICAEGANGTSGTHGLIHSEQKKAVMDKFPGVGIKEIRDTKTQSFEDAVQQGGNAAHEIHPQCSAKCIKAQLRREHRKMGITGKTEVRPIAHGPKDISKFKKAFQALHASFAVAAIGIG